MSGSIARILRIQFFLLLCSSYAFGQNLFFGGSPDPNIGVVTSNDFVLFYVVDEMQDFLSLSIKDKDFNQQLAKDFYIGKDYIGVNHVVVEKKVYLLLSNRRSYKILCVINTQNSDIQFFPISVNLGTIDRFKIIDNTLLVVQSLEKGDFVQMYDYRTGILISLSELFYPKTRIWDVQVKDGIFDILVHKKGDSRNQSLKMIGFNPAGSKLYETEILLPNPKKQVFKSGNLISSQKSGYSIVGTYSRKQGEQFSGYYHVGINDFLEQKATIHPMRSLDGFFDYKKNPGLRKNAKNLRRDMIVYHTENSRDFIALASSSGRVVRKFTHFIVLDHAGGRIYDTSIKVFYGIGSAFYSSTLALIGKDLYFVFEGSPKYNVLPGYKMYQISDGNLTGLLKAGDYIQVKRNNSNWEEVQYYHWKDNKFIVLGIETMDGLPRYVIQKIEV